MSRPAISLVASANRPVLQSGFKNWERFMNSLTENTIKYEVIFVGDVECPYPMPDNFKWIKASVKPSQCYQIGFWASEAELIHWTADDADYNHPNNNCPNALDIAYKCYKDAQEKYKDNKTMVAMRPIEDGGDVQEKWHYLFGGCPWSPRMAPFGVLDREFFLNDIKGYPNDHVSGQTENSVIMSGLALGGRVEFCREAFLYVHHKMVHPRNAQGEENNKFREWYNEDRKALENRWIVNGYGKYEKYTASELQNIVEISNTPLVPVTPFKNTEDVCTITQGPKGRWE